MKTVIQYREEIKMLVESIATIRDSAVNENRDLTMTEADKLDEILNMIEDLEKLIATEERTQTKLAKLSLPDKPITVPNDGNASGNVSGNQLPLNDAQTKRDQFASIGEQFAAIIRAETPGGSTDPRLMMAENRAATGLSESVPSDGGFLLQDNFAQVLLAKAFETGLLATMCRQMPISVGTTLKIPGVDETSRATGSRAGGVRGYWADEATEKTASKPKFRQIELNLHKLIGLCYTTDELLQDARALGAYITTAFGDEFGFLIDEAIINGTGAGQPLGIMNAGCMVSVTKESGQTADTIVFENVTKMWSRLIANARSGAIWLINQDCEPTLQSMKVATNFPVYLPPGGATAQPYGTIFGRPVRAIEQAATIGDTGDILLCAFDRGYIFSQKGGIASDMSIHVRFVYDESVFRFVVRLDGQPLLRTSITPFKSSLALSHFVKLDERA